MEDLFVIIFTLNILLAGIFNVSLVYLLTEIKFQKRHLLIVVPVLMLLTAMSLYSNLFSIVSAVLELAIYYIYFGSKSNKIVVLNSLFIGYCIDTLANSISNIVQELFPLLIGATISALISLVVYCIAFFLLRKYRSILVNLFTDDRISKLFLYLLLYLYVSSILLNLAVVYKRWLYSPAITLTIVILIQVAFAISMFWFDLHIQKGLLDKQEQELRAKYLQDLEASEDRIRKFKHDYLNLLTSLRGSAQSSKDKALLKELDKYSQEHINEGSLWKYKNLNHIKNEEVKGLILDKLNTISNENIMYTLECEQEISVLPQNIKLFDLLRIIGIVLDNAIEESQFIVKRLGDSSKSEINIMLYQSQAGSFEFKVKNKYFPRNINVNEIKKKHATTKPHHMGYGLANINEINEKYDNMFIEYNVSQEWFVFSMIID